MKRFRTTLVITICCMGIFALALMVCGCMQSSTTPSGSSATTSSSAISSSSSSSAVASSDLPVIGAGDTTVQVKNETGSDIIGLRIKPAGDASYTAENSFDGFVFENGSSVDLSFTKQSGVQSYDVLLLTAEDSKIAVRDIDLVGTKDIVLHFEEGIGFITYTDAATGESFDNRADAIDAEEDAPAVPHDLETQKG